MNARSIALMGATGSIGASTLEVVRTNPEHLSIHSVSGFSRIDELRSIIQEFKPARAAVSTPAQAAELSRQFGPQLDVVYGPEGLCDLAQDPAADVVVAAIVGAAGLASTMAAADAGKTIALANKEALVMAGDLLMDRVARTGSVLLPVDSEHNAIFQSLPTDYVCGHSIEGFRKIWLTCSGGPFRDQPDQDFDHVTPAMACAHPNWSMGQKISVDSATLMNKGLELIEACYLFAVAPQDVEVVIHPQSVIHSLVEYVDGSFISQLGQTDMRVPIANALAYPGRVDSGVQRLDLATLSALTFNAPDHERFPALSLARQAVDSAQHHCIALNAINECAVADFLSGHLKFSQIPQRVAQGLESLNTYPIDSLEAVLEADQQARQWYREFACH